MLDPMIVEQIIEVPVNRRIFLDLPPELPFGKVRVLIFPLAENSFQTDMSLLSMRGSCKGIDTMDAYFARKQADKALENHKTENT